MPRNKAKLNARKKPLQARSQQTVDCILEATTHILEKEGLLALSTNRVAQEAGVSIGSLYQYFPAKEALLSALVERKLHADQCYFQAALKGFELWSIDRRIRELIAAGIALHRRDRRILKVMFEQLGASGQMELVKEMNLQLFQLLNAWISMLPEFANRKDLVPARAYVYMQSILGVWHSQVEKPWSDLDAGEVTETLTQMILSDLRR